MATAESELPPGRRSLLAEKAQRLYGKYCGTGGRGICAESFAVYHIGRGEAVVAEDLVVYLDEVIAALIHNDPHGRLSATQGLAARVRRHLAEAVGPQGTPNNLLQQSGSALRSFVMCSSHCSTE